MKRLLIIAGIITISCNNAPAPGGQSNESVLTAKDSSIVYQTEELQVHRLSPHVYAHVSFLQTKDFGNVDCNGMILLNEGEAVVFDTPAGDSSSAALIKFVTEKLQCRIKAIIPTHFHEDCVAGLEIFREHHIPAIASRRTIDLLKKEKPVAYIESFEDSLTLSIGNKKAYARYFGEGHTTDNIVGWFPADNALFGGCLIKTTGATKGYLADAKVQDWSATVRKIQESYPQLSIVIPGHGEWGGKDLLDYTIRLFEE